jgi:hypothetical protein
LAGGESMRPRTGMNKIRDAIAAAGSAGIDGRQLMAIANCTPGCLKSQVRRIKLNGMPIVSRISGNKTRTTMYYASEDVAPPAKESRYRNRKKPDKSRPKVPSRENQLIALLAEAGEKGITYADLAALKWPRRTALTIAQALCAAGKAHRVSQLADNRAGRITRIWADAAHVKGAKPMPPKVVHKVERNKPPILKTRILGVMKLTGSGMFVAEISTRLGVDHQIVSKALSRMQHAGEVLSIAAPSSESTRRRRFYAAESPPTQRDLDYWAAQARPAKLQTPKRLSAGWDDDTPTDASNAKITPAASAPVSRYAVEKAEPMFAALSIGSYLPGESWAVRAGYGS